MSPADRAGLEARLRAEGLEPTVWSSMPGERFGSVVRDVGRKFGTRAQGRGSRW